MYYLGFFQLQVTESPLKQAYTQEGIYCLLFKAVQGGANQEVSGWCQSGWTERLPETENQLMQLLLGKGAGIPGRGRGCSL